MGDLFKVGDKVFYKDMNNLFTIEESDRYENCMKLNSVTKEYYIYMSNYTINKSIQNGSLVKVEDEINSKTSKCLHKNTRKDSFFSARIYITCLDCGEKLE